VFTIRFSFFLLTTSIGTATPSAVREAHHLAGLMPATVETMELQCQRALKQLRRYSDPLEKYIFLSRLRNTNVRLFYKLLLDNLKVSILVAFHWSTVE
jgi:malate dehydrogenase (oxaloacetate-decarboxylating)(NADP+)